jgi:hypothetical protein
MGGIAADDWRVTVTFSHASRVGRVAQAVRERLAADGRHRGPGYRVVLSVDGPRLFLYTGSADAAREADRVTREVLALRQLAATVTLDRWHPVAQEWRDASVPMPESDDELAAERLSRMDAETEQSRATGQAAWQVRVALPSHREAVELAARLRADGRPVIRRWKYLVLGADNESDAGALAKLIGQTVSAQASIQVATSPSVDTRPLMAGEAAAVFFYL